MQKHECLYWFSPNLYVLYSALTGEIWGKTMFIMALKSLLEKKRKKTNELFIIPKFPSM